MQNIEKISYQNQPGGGNGEGKGLWPCWLLGTESSELALTWAGSPDGAKVQVSAA